MLISLCTPCMNRKDDLMATMPSKIAAAKASPPVEIAVVDYNSGNGLRDFINDIIDSTYLGGGGFFTYRKYTGRDTYHAAHANNLAMMLGGGEYVVLIPADVFIEPGFILSLRENIDQGCVWSNTSRKHRSAIAILRNEFIAMGGYDEHFEMYGPDDIDIIERLERRGCKRGEIPDEFVSSIYTPPDRKVENYRIKASHKELGAMNMPHLSENRKNGVLVANSGIEWGKW